MKADPHWAKDALVGDACEAQRQSGIMPKTEDVDQYFVGILERLEKKDKERKPVSSVAKKERKVELEAQKRAERNGFRIDGTWSIEHTPLAMGGDVVVPTKDTPKQKLLRHRIRLLQSKPDWRKRLMIVNPFALQGRLGPEKQSHAVEMIKQVIRDSNVIFGDWRKAKPKKAWSYKGQEKR